MSLNLMPHRPLTPATKALLTSMTIWGVIALALMLIELQQSPNTPPPKSTLSFVVRTFYPFSPLFLLSWVLGIVLAKAPQQWLRPRRVAALLLFIIMVALPLLFIWDVVVATINAGKPLQEAFSNFHSAPLMWLWIDLLLLSMTVAIQLAITAFQANRQRELSLLQSEQHNTQLKLERLQGQLEPHFLFNALNTISALVRSADRATAVSALARLSELLRYALHASQHNWMSVQDEINFLKDYLVLQQLRFSDRLTISMNIAKEQWETFGCPPLLIQPIIENAVRHGLESHEDQCEISITVAIQQDHIVFEVRNPLPAPMHRKPGHGVGLRATQERLHLIYAEKASLITAKTAEQFIATLTIPYRDII